MGNAAPFMMRYFGCAIVSASLVMVSTSGVAAPIGSVGPSDGEATLLFGLPLLGSGIIALLMLFSWRTFAALMGAVLVASLWVAFVFSTLVGSSSIGLNSYLATLAVLSAGWVVFSIFVTAYWLSRLPGNSASQSPSEIGYERTDH